MYTWRRYAAAILLAGAWARPAAAQFGVSGEATATFGTHDDIAFFNYTDYEHNALRMFRLSLAGMWRPTERLAFLGEVRSEDVRDVVPYALYVRVRPFKGRAFDIQAGRIPPVFGAFPRRGYGVDANPLIGYPLAYQYLTSLRPDAIPANADDLLAMRARGWRSNFPVGSATQAPGVPLVSAYRWDTGVEGHAAFSRFEVAAALTTGTLANPRVDDDNGGRQIAGRVAWKPITGLIVGGSAARGEFLTRAIADTYEPVFGHRSYAQRTYGIDVEYSRGYLLIRGESIASRFDLPKLNIPFIGAPLGSRGTFVEARYRLSPRYYVAARVDQLTFSKIRGERLFDGQEMPWDAPVRRIEAGGGFYLLRSLVARAVVQHNWRDAGRVRERTFVSGQVSFTF
jgi:hypothetical protein